MDDLYRKYSIPPGERDSISRSSFPGYLSSETSSLAPQHSWISNDYRGASRDYARKDTFALNDGIGIGGHRDPVLNGLIDRGSVRRYSFLDDPSVISQRQDVPVGMSPAHLDIKDERPDSLRKIDGGVAVSTGESNILFVDGLPTDCTRREVGHLFRPFVGFKEIRVVHKEPRRSGDKARVLCFVEFDDARCALTALEALHGYKFDDRKAESPLLRIDFAHFPFRPPLDNTNAAESFKMAR